MFLDVDTTKYGKCLRIWDIALLVECLSNMHEVLTLIPLYHIKPTVVAQAYNLYQKVEMIDYNIFHRTTLFS